jgi:hypothetical protein
MRNWLLLGALLGAGLMIPLIGCTNPSGLDSISVTPSSQSLIVGQSTQFGVTGTYGNANHATSQPVTSGVTWASSSSTIVTVDPASGNATAKGAGTATITATAQGFRGPVSASATLTVTAPAGSGSAPAGEDLLSITILPGSITTDNLLGTGQFLAYGTFANPPIVMDITNGFTRTNGTTTVTTPVTWISDAQTIFPVNSAGAAGATGGLVTAEGSGTADIYAVAKYADGTVVYSPSVTFNCPYAAPTPANPGDPTANPPVAPTAGSPGTCNEDTVAPGLLVTLTVFNAGLNTSGWLLTAPSATGTQDVISCGPGSTAGSVCTATYPLNTTVTITAPAEQGVAFGGWSWNCTPTVPVTATGTNQCRVTLGNDNANTSNESVGAIFNNQ